MRSIISALERLTGRRINRSRIPNFLMNRYERQPQPDTEAVVEYLDGEYRVRKPGAYVRCAVTGEPIPLEDLRYWNVDLQEPYSGPHAKLMRLGVKKPD
jgi:hypothetical protein